MRCLKGKGLTLRNNKISAIMFVLFRTVFFIGMAYVLLFPVLVMLSRSLRSSADMYNPTIVWIPQHFTMENFKIAFDMLDYGRIGTLTGRIAIVSTILTMISCSMCGYALGRFKLKGKAIVMVVLISTIIVPIQSYLIPLFFRFRFFDFFGIGQVTSLFGGEPLSVNLAVNELSYYILAATGSGIRSGLFILVFFQSFKSMPKELDDASRIDGCGEFGTFIRVMVPNAGAPYLVTFILSMVWYWNDTVYSSVLLKSKMLLASRISNIRSILESNAVFAQSADGAGETVIIFAASLLFVLPPLIMYLFAQKFFMQSVERSGIVG